MKPTTYLTTYLIALMIVFLALSGWLGYQREALLSELFDQDARVSELEKENANLHIMISLLIANRMTLREEPNIQTHTP